MIIIIKRICATLIFSKGVALDQNNYSKFKAVYITNYKNNMIKTEKKN